MTVLSARKKRVVTPGLVCHGKVAGWPPTSSFLLFYPPSPIFVSNFLVLSTTRSSLSRLLLCFPPFSSPFHLSTRVSFVPIPFEPRLACRCLWHFKDLFMRAVVGVFVLNTPGPPLMLFSDDIKGDRIDRLCFVSRVQLRQIVDHCL